MGGGDDGRKSSRTKQGCGHAHRRLIAGNLVQAAFHICLGSGAGA